MGAIQAGGTADGVLVRLNAACKRYRWRSSWVLRDVNLSVDAGCLVEVRGPNGAGKSTLLRMLAGATLPTRGRRVAAAGLDVGYGPERLAPTPPFPAAGYLAHQARLRRLPRNEGEARAARLAGRLGLTSGLLHEPLAALSKGSLQKVVVIQALLGLPALVVLDEPFAGLDVDASQALRELIGEAIAAGSTVVFSDHRERDLRPGPDFVWSVSDACVHEHALDSPSWRLSELPGVLEVHEADGRLRLVVNSECSDHVLATLVAHGWHVTAVQVDAAPDLMQIEAASPAGAR